MNKAKDIIDRMGGPTKVACLLGLSGTPGAVQRVSNWKKRGIPPRVILDHPALFQPFMSPSERAADGPESS